MAEAKLAVLSLCRLLKLVSNVDIKPEHVRLAKFNTDRQDVVEIFEKLLDRLLQQQGETEAAAGGEGGTGREAARPEGIAAARGSSAGLAAEQGRLVSSAVGEGSRQLLLALGRIVSGHLLDQLVLQRISTLLSGVQGQPRAGTGITAGVGRVLEDQHNHGLWLAGRIRHATNDLAEMRKVSAGPQLSLWQTDQMLRRRPDLVEAYLGSVAAAAELLDAYKQWVERAGLFQSWMESVQRACPSAPSSKTDPAAVASSTRLHISASQPGA